MLHCFPSHCAMSSALNLARTIWDSRMHRSWHGTESCSYHVKHNDTDWYKRTAFNDFGSVPLGSNHPDQPMHTYV